MTRGLELLDDQLLDGLEFCRRAYQVFDAIRNGPKGIEELRMLTSYRAKKLVEEVLPLVTYVQSRYSPGLRLRIRWRGGNQPYDAILASSGSVVENRSIPRRQYLEVTSAVHQNDYLVREHLNREGFAFAARSTFRDRKTKRVVSSPSGYSNREPQDELVELVRRRIVEKSSIDYPKPVSLLVRCVVGMPILDDEWEYVVRELRKDEPFGPFREVILIEHVSQRCTALYVRRKWRRVRPNVALNPTSQWRSEPGVFDQAARG